MTTLPPATGPGAPGRVRNPQRVRMLDVAAHAGVSRTTVSMVMQGVPVVAPETREAVLRAADELGYIYNRGAAGLRTHSSNLVGLVVTDSSNPFFAEIAVSIGETLAAAGYLVTQSNTFDDPARQGWVIESLAQQRAAGILLVPAVGTTGEHLRPLVASDIPVVALTRRMPGLECSYIGSDDPIGGRLAADHLADHGARRFAFFGGANQPGTARRSREVGFTDRFAERGGALVAGWADPQCRTAVDSHRAATSLLAAGEPPEALLCNSDTIAYGALRALHDRGIPPSVCRVVGFDDLDQSAVAIPALSSLSVRPDVLGDLGARTLLSHLAGDRTTATHVRTPTLSARESCGCTTTS